MDGRRFECDAQVIGERLHVFFVDAGGRDAGAATHDGPLGSTIGYDEAGNLIYVAIPLRHIDAVPAAPAWDWDASAHLLEVRLAEDVGVLTAAYATDDETVALLVADSKVVAVRIEAVPGLLHLSAFIG